MLNDPNELLVGNLIIEARKQHPSIAPHLIHDAYLDNRIRVRSGGAIDIVFGNGVVHGAKQYGYTGTIR